MTLEARECPFRTKGLVYQGAREFYAIRLRDKMDGLERALQDDGLLAFWRQPFVAGGWYDVLPIVPISRAAARAAGVPHWELVRENARWLALRDIHGVYRALLRLASVELVASRLPRAAIQYFDFGTAKGEQRGPGRFRGSQSGVPEPLAAWLMVCVEGFVPVALEIAGARDAQVLSAGIRKSGARGGIPTVDMEYDISWS